MGLTVRRHLSVIQPTPFCNLDCSYCHLPHRSLRGRMSLDILRSAFRFVLRGGLDFSEYIILWHAGEPTTVGVDFYKAASSVLKDEVLPGQRVVQSMQTNGTLISDQWVDFFRSENVHVGVSIDGPRFLNDLHRVRRNSTGTYEESIMGLRMLLAGGVSTSIITVLTLDSMNYPNEIYDWCVGENITSIAFNPEETEGVNTSSLREPGSDSKYAAFLFRFLERSVADGFRIKVREFEGCRNLILGYAADRSTFNQQVEPWAIINIDYEGNVSSFSPELLGHVDANFSNFVFGNVRDADIETCRRSMGFEKLANAIEKGVRQCSDSCQYFRFCGGGAPSNKYFEHGSFEVGETLGCRFGQQIPLEVTLRLLQTHYSLARS
jgi:uncharacterized protein